MRPLRLAIPIILAAFAGCGGTSSTSHKTAPPREQVNTTNCARGIMGGCVPHPVQAPAIPLPQALASATLVPDVSEWNEGCALYSEAIFRIYEAGTGRQDSKAACHAQALKAKGVWSAAYAFVRPPGYGQAGSCTAQADRTVNIVIGVGGVVGPIIEDAEVSLPYGFVRCFLARVRARGFAAVVTYTSTGTASGGPFDYPLWMASYGAVPKCLEGKCARVAWQFSSTYRCRGVIGDCSVNEGILGIRQHATPPVPKRVLVARLHDHERNVRKLRAVILARQCAPGDHRHALPRSRKGRQDCNRFLARGLVENRKVAYYDRLLGLPVRGVR